MNEDITTPDGGCVFCPDGHSDPNTRPFAAWVTKERDYDGQAISIMVATTNGAHIAESDAQWIRDLLNNRVSVDTRNGRALALHSVKRTALSMPDGIEHRKIVCARDHEEWPCSTRRALTEGF